MEVKNLCKAYHGCPVLQNVSFAAGVGITALWAPSGAGKTTLLRLLLGLERPDSGQLVGTDIRWSAVNVPLMVIKSSPVFTANAAPS